MNMGNISTVVLAEAAAPGRIFGLDAQLVHDAVLLGINIFIIFVLASYLLFKPARELLKKRQDKIQGDLDAAAQDKEKAAALVSEYTEKLDKVDVEAEAILSEARRKAKMNENQIVEQAKEEAGRIVKRAEGEIELERKRALEDVKQEMIDIASVMAKKAVSDQVDVNIQDRLVEETIREMTEETWQSK